jgi:hypothetical protein
MEAIRSNKHTSLPHFDKFLPIIDAARGGPLLMKLKKKVGKFAMCEVFVDEKSTEN